MSGTLRELRRAPLRSAATVAALALAVAALGILAVPGVSSSSLRALAAEDHLSHLAVDTTPLPDAFAPEAIAGVTEAEARVSGTIRLPSGDPLEVVGVDPVQQSVDVVSATEGRLPERPGEVLVTPALRDTGLSIGDRLPGPGSLSVVGVGSTAAFDVEPVAVVTPATAEALLGVDGPTEVLLRVEDPTEEALASTTEELRSAVAAVGATFTGFPETFVGGAHPLEAEIAMVSAMIGMLGVVAGAVALVLLATTTAAVISERSAQTAVLRAMGSGPRATRAALRRPAMAAAALAAVIGIPLGIAVANVIARMVLERFAGITPGVVLSLPLVALSLAFLLVGARLASAHAARRAVAVPLAPALRDRDGVPFGHRWWHRAAGRVRARRLVPETVLAAGRAGLWRPGRTTGLTLQVASGAAAVLVVASLGASLAEFDAAEVEPWRFGAVTAAVDSSGGWPATLGDGLPGTGAPPPGEETGLSVDGSLADTEVEVLGMARGTRMIDTTVVSGRWVSGPGVAPTAPGPPEAVVTAGFAERRGIELGDRVELTLPSGVHRVEVVGLHRLRSIAVFLDREVLGSLLGRPGAANVVWSPGEPGAVAAAAGGSAATSTVTLADLTAEDRAGRSMIMGIFWAIGIVVTTVAAIGFASSVQMLVHERRRELATVRAAGGSAGALRRMLVAEVLPVTALGVVSGAVLAHLGARALMSAIESAEALEIGYAFALGALPGVAVGAALVTVALALVALRPVLRRSPATLLRAAA